MGDESSEAVSRQVLQHALQEARPRVDVIQKTLQLLAERKLRVIEEDCLLHAASSRGHVDVVRFLIERGAPVNAQLPDEHRSGLWAAAFNGHLECVRLLIEGGGDVNAAVRAPRASASMLERVVMLSVEIDEL